MAAATACARAGFPARAQRYLRRKAAVAAVVTPARAEVALAEGDPDTATRHFTDAADGYDDLGHCGDARTCRDRAEVAGGRALVHRGP